MSLAGSWALPADLSTDRLIAVLAEHFGVEAGKPRRGQMEFLDAFLHPVWHGGALLYRQAGRLHFQAADGASRSWRASAVTPRFWWDIPEPVVRDELKHMLGYWSLDVAHELVLVESVLVLRNSDEKIVLRARLRTWQGDDGAHQLLELRPLRGYDREAEKVMALLSDRGATQAAGDDVRAVLQSQGLDPVAISLKGPYGICPEQGAEEAVRQMAVTMFDHARLFEPGILEDRDTEFVHHYRVSLRKLHSLISLMSACLAAGEAADLKRRLAGLGSAMGRLRDLDVFLLAQDRYRHLLPAPYQSGFVALIKAAKRDRTQALAATRRFLQSGRYAKQCEALRERLDLPPAMAGPASKRPVQTVASKKILARYLKTRKAALRIGPHSPDDDVHAVRIECKKLRYMLEFFAELYPDKHIKPLSKALKRLQDLLGQFNDYAVQQEFLADYARGGEQAAAVHGLIVSLHQKQLEIRTEVQGELSEFFGESILQGFTVLFGKPTRG